MYKNIFLGLFFSFSAFMVAHITEIKMCQASGIHIHHVQGSLGDMQNLADIVIPLCLPAGSIPQDIASLYCQALKKADHDKHTIVALPLLMWDRNSQSQTITTIQDILPSVRASYLTDIYLVENPQSPQYSFEKADKKSTSISSRLRRYGMYSAALLGLIMVGIWYEDHQRGLLWKEGKYFIYRDRYTARLADLLTQWFGWET